MNKIAQQGRADRLHRLRERADKYENLTRAALPEHLPDPLKDNARKRARTVDKQVQGLVPRLLTAAGDDLQVMMVPLWYGPATDLYRRAAHTRARQTVRVLVGNSPCWVKLEWSEAGQLHVHIIISTDAPVTLPTATGATTRPVYDLLGLLRYLAKPGDARAAMVRQSVGGGTVTVQATDENKLAAYHDYLKARLAARGRRFPDISWTLNVPR